MSEEDLETCQKKNESYILDTNNHIELQPNNLKLFEMEDFFTPESISLIITFLSLVIAIWQYVQSRKTKKLIALEAVELHNNVSIALGAIQAAKGAINAGGNPSIEVGRAEGLCQAVLHESVKLFCNLANTDVDDIDYLIRCGQLNGSYKDLYYSYSDNKRGLLRRWLKGIYK